MKNHPKPTNLEQLRNKVLDIFERVIQGKVDIAEAAVIAKLNEGIISGLKTEMDYCRLSNHTPNIPFLDHCLGDSNKKLLQNNSH